MWGGCAPPNPPVCFFRFLNLNVHKKSQMTTVSVIVGHILRISCPFPHCTGVPFNTHQLLLWFAVVPGSSLKEMSQVGVA